MDTQIQDSIMDFGRAVILWSYGWKRRKRRYYTQFYVEWRDPDSGLWYSKPTAYQLVKLRARHLLH
jgi:hypothetical protein